MRKFSLILCLFLLGCPGLTQQTARGLELGNALTMGKLVEANMTALGYMYGKKMITETEWQEAAAASIRAGEALEFIADNPDSPINHEKYNVVRTASEALHTLIQAAVRR